MIFLGVSADAYTAPAPPADTGDNVPAAFGPLNITASTASGTASTSFQITDCDGVYEFYCIIVDKTGGSDVGSDPINLQGTGTATNSGYVVGDTVNMVLEGPAVGGATTNYRIRIYDGTDLVQTGYANVTYAVAPDVTISALLLLLILVAPLKLPLLLLVRQLLSKLLTLVLLLRQVKLLL